MATDVAVIELERGDAPAAEDLHARAMADYDAAWQRDRENIEQAYEDLEFLTPDGQWDGEIRQRRELEGRPCLTENRLPQFVRQITGDIRQMRPSIKAVPVNSEGDVETAKVIAGMLRYIENRSMAPAVYFRAADSQVQAGRGAWRIETEYASETTMEQELRIAPIEDGISVLFDPDAILPCKSDAMFCFVPVDMSPRAFKAKYPDKSADSISMEGRAFQSWYGEDFVRVAEYWWKEPVERVLLIGGGQVKDMTDAGEEELAQAEEFVSMAAQAGMPIRMEKRQGHKVRRAILSGSEVLEEPTDWPGQHIPIVPLDGEEIRIGRRVVRMGAIRNARDPQRRLNYFISAETETVALQPKAPFIGTEANFEDYEDEWEAANQENRPFLRYKPDPLNNNAAPARVQPAVSSQGISQGIELAAAGLQATTGIYNASLGAASNETSGKAISARQREGDTGTYVYVEHFGQALQRTGQILIDLIPHVYDTTREMRIVGDDGTEELVQINKPASLAEGDDEASAVSRIENDVTVGAYDVVIEMGPSYNTRREEARDGMIAFLQASPQIAPVMLDLVAKMQDWPLADEVRERLEALLPPPVKAAMAAKKGEPPPAPPPPSPEQQQAAMQAQRQAELADRQHQLDLAKLQLEQQKLQAEMAKASAALQQAQIESDTRIREAAHGAAAATASGQDPRVDHVIAAVQRLDGMVGQIIAALSAGQGAPPAADPGSGPPDIPPGPALATPEPSQPAAPPPGGFFMPGSEQPGPQGPLA